MQVIVPAAGLSTRFPGMRPKYTLVDYQGNHMIDRAIEHLVGRFDVMIGVLREHDEQYSIKNHLRDRYGDRIQLVVLPERTLGPADTVMQILKRADINSHQSILIKDCDSFFRHEHDDGNYVCVSSIADHEVLKRLAAKSFVRCNDQDIVTDIIEKQVISDLFCVGGYHFRDHELFRAAYRELQYHDHELFVSHVIQRLLESGEIFLARRVQQYVDVGTATDWHEYNDKNVIFCDIDGTVIKAQPRDCYHEPAEALTNTVARLLALQDQGHQIVFTTARPQSADSATRAMLQGLGFRDFELLSGLLNARRILINDYNAANPYPRAVAINVRRDQDTAGDFL
jgi:dTDP-glucose pyrophosphorylase